MVVAVEAVVVEAGTVAIRARPACISSPAMEFDAGPIKVGITVCTERPDLLCGCRVFVHCDGQPPGPLPVIDTNGQPLVNDLADGQEVEIIAWRPRARVGPPYHGGVLIACAAKRWQPSTIPRRTLRGGDHG